MNKHNLYNITIILLILSLHQQNSTVYPISSTFSSSVTCDDLICDHSFSNLCLSIFSLIYPIKLLNRSFTPKVPPTIKISNPIPVKSIISVLDRIMWRHCFYLAPFIFVLLFLKSSELYTIVFIDGSRCNLSPLFRFVKQGTAST